MPNNNNTPFTKWLNQTSLQEVNLVGGKNASLGQMISNLQTLNINIPNGFVVTTHAYSTFLNHNNLTNTIQQLIHNNNQDQIALRRSSKKIRILIQNGSFPEHIQNEIIHKYNQLSNEYSDNSPLFELDVAVRSSATTEDLPNASFAGQQDTYLNVRGKNQLIEKIKSCFASVFNERAIDYRYNLGFNNADIKLSVCIQKMIRSDLAAAGVAFSIDTESGNKNTILINSSYGLGEIVVSGQVAPDEFLVFKPTLNLGFKSIIDKKLGNKKTKLIYSDNQDKRIKEIPVEPEKQNKFSIDNVKIIQLAQWVTTLEKYYSNIYNKWTPVDIEWAIDGTLNKLFILQARPETIHSNSNQNTLITYSLNTDTPKTPILTGTAVGNKIGSGTNKILFSLDDRQNQVSFNKGDILITEITDPDWEPIMKNASAIITEKGGRTCFAGDTIILTNHGFIPIKKLMDINFQNYTTPSINKKTLHIEWKPITHVMCDIKHTIRISTNNYNHDDYIDTTPDHKFIHTLYSNIHDSPITNIINKYNLLLANFIPNIQRSYYQSIHDLFHNKSTTYKLLHYNQYFAKYFLKNKIINKHFQTNNTQDLQNIIIALLRTNTPFHTININNTFHIYTHNKIFNLKYSIPDFNDNVMTSKTIFKQMIHNIKGNKQHIHNINKLLNSHTRHTKYPPSIIQNYNQSKQEVYNITVKDNHTYIVFSSNYTPILVNNCHAAIVARELGIPTIVGAKDATKILQNNDISTVSCAEGETGYIYNGNIPFSINKTNIDELPKINTKIMMNIASPDKAFQFAKIPNNGVGLAREEFIINNFIKIHPLALIHPDKIPDQDVIQQIQSIIQGYKSPISFFIKKLSYGIARIAAAFYPNDVIIRFSDFKSNEYSNLIGGKYFEPNEENPMIGWRGASRYYSKEYQNAFGLECEAIKYVREIIGLDNIIVMIPFCRTPQECQLVLDTMKKFGLERGVNKLKVYLMCEIPSNVIQADEFCKLVDGFSIGSNDLTQLTLGIDRDSELVQHIYNEQNNAVKSLISSAIKTCKKNNTKIGICGQAPSDFPLFAKFLIDEGIDSISLTPDSIIHTIQSIASLSNP